MKFATPEQYQAFRADLIANNAGYILAEMAALNILQRADAPLTLQPNDDLRKILANATSDQANVYWSEQVGDVHLQTIVAPNPCSVSHVPSQILAAVFKPSEFADAILYGVIDKLGDVENPYSLNAEDGEFPIAYEVPTDHPYRWLFERAHRWAFDYTTNRAEAVEFIRDQVAKHNFTVLLDRVEGTSKLVIDSTGLPVMVLDTQSETVWMASSVLRFMRSLGFTD